MNMSARDAKNRADLDRLLQGFKGIADSQTFGLIEEYANFKKATSTVETAIINVRLVTTVLTEMGMQEPIRVLKIRDPEDGRRKVFKDGVSSMVLPDLTRKDIRAYFGNLPHFGKTSDKSYKAPLWDLLTWLGKEETTKTARKKWDRIAEAIGDWSDAVRDISETIQPEHVEKLLDAITRGFCFHAQRDENLTALLWEAGLRDYEIEEIRLGDVGKSARGPNVMALAISSPRTEHGQMYLRGEGTKKIHPRTIEVYEATPFLVRWLKQHPTPDNPDTYLFPSFSNNNRNGKLGNSSLSKLFQKATEGAGITDVPIFAYRFRTSRITYVLRMRLMTIDEAKEYFGTGLTTIMKHYRRVTGDMVNANYISNFQPDAQEEVTPQHLSKKACPECSEKLPPQARSCPYCDTLLLPVFGKARDSTLKTLVRLIAETDNKEVRESLLKTYEMLEAQGPKEETTIPVPEGELPAVLKEWAKGE